MNRRPTPSIIDDVLTADATRPATIRNDAIKVDGGTQMRAQLDAATVTEYADTMAEAGWGKFPPIIAYYDGSDYWLADGFHRLAAFRSIANYSDALIPADVRSGTRRDAILHAAGANASHGLRRTNADKRRAVETLLRDDEWAVWSDGEIARRCAVSQPFVSDVRKKLTQNGYESPAVRKGADGRITNTTNIGAKPGPAVQPIPTPTAKEYSAAVQADQPRTVGSMAQTYVRHLLGEMDTEAALDHVTSMAGARVIEQTFGCQFSIARLVATAASDLLTGILDTNAAANANAATVQIIEYDAAAFTVPDGRIPAAQRLIALYRETIATESQYGALTGHFSDWLAPKRELEAMIGHLQHLIAIIEHPEEVTPAAD